MVVIQISERQENIINIVKEHGPIKGEEIADILGLVHSTLRADLSFLTKSGILDARPRVGYYFSEKSITTRVRETMEKIRVKDMKAVPAVVSDKSTVYDVVVNLFMMDVGTLFIVSDGGLLEGVVSRKDLLKIALGKADIHKIPITVIMTRMPNVITVEPDDTILFAAQKLVEHQIDSLPVVKPKVWEGREGLEVVGRVTKTTVTKAYVELGKGKYF